MSKDSFCKGTGKRCYPSVNAAYRSVKKGSHGRDIKGKAYYCDECGQYHLARRTEGRPRRPRWTK